MPQTNPSKNQEDQSKSMVMSHNSRHSIDSCTLQLHSWRPFLDSDPPANSKPCASSRTLPKRPCLSDRATSFSSNIDSIDISKLSLLQDDSSSSNIKPIPHRSRHYQQSLQPRYLTPYPAQEAAQRIPVRVRPEFR
ncbi:LYR MOTIF PROTEIN [Salix purpurea]|uniref:LYR MOTIF PROTEIN n=1 Tax=Salix purpurea TaxID=77065 RepID=A0A9Q0P235_SALPP|nr:LYR MOTIF PROTEIN [Salix purpurea]